MLNVVTATPEQTEKIAKKYTPTIGTVKCSYDNEDNIYFLSGKCGLLKNASASWQVRSGRPMFLEVTKGGTRYDIPYPEVNLFASLKKISDKTIDDWKAGSEL